MHKKNIVFDGKPLEEADIAIILLHGRGGSSSDILSLAPLLDAGNAAMLAPRADNNSWYPQPFLRPVHENEPHLSAAISLLDQIVSDIVQSGLKSTKIFFIGFSQGACLSLEYVSRKGQKFGGVGALSGGLIGETIELSRYKNGLANTPVFIGSSDPDPYIPAERVRKSAKVLEELGADVLLKIYTNMGHTITPDEIKLMNNHLFNRQYGNV